MDNRRIAGEIRIDLAVIKVSPARHGIINARPSAVLELATKRSTAAMMTIMMPNIRRNPG
jgi:hypothetical protein